MPGPLASLLQSALQRCSWPHLLIGVCFLFVIFYGPHLLNKTMLTLVTSKTRHFFAVLTASSPTWIRPHLLAVPSCSYPLISIVQRISNCNFIILYVGCKWDDIKLHIFFSLSSFFIIYYYFLFHRRITPKVQHAWSWGKWDGPCFAADIPP